MKFEEFKREKRGNLVQTGVYLERELVERFKDKYGKRRLSEFVEVALKELLNEV